MKNITLEILLFFGGTFFYGLRNMFGKWLVTLFLDFARRQLIKTERDLALWLHYRNKALAGKSREREPVHYEIDKN